VAAASVWARPCGIWFWPYGPRARRARPQYQSMVRLARLTTNVLLSSLRFVSEGSNDCRLSRSRSDPSWPRAPEGLRSRALDHLLPGCYGLRRRRSVRLPGGIPFRRWLSPPYRVEYLAEH